jgi:large subunit ribosomal protein L21
VTGRVLGEGRADKVLVFHYKRKKQYKKLNGHRQPFTAVRITEIAYDGQKFTAPELPEKAPKPKKARPAEETAEVSAAPSAKKKSAKKSGKKASAGKKSSSKKSKK